MVPDLSSPQSLIHCCFSLQNAKAFHLEWPTLPLTWTEGLPGPGESVASVKSTVTSRFKAPDMTHPAQPHSCMVAESPCTGRGNILPGFRAGVRPTPGYGEGTTLSWREETRLCGVPDSVTENTLGLSEGVRAKGPRALHTGLACGSTVSTGQPSAGCLQMPVSPARQHPLPSSRHEHSPTATILFY